tara:strand:- start:2969 stop:3154 length:186 start_codon:yes stop_codon:yes gene_type:complete
MKDYLSSKYYAGILAKQIRDNWKQKGIDVEVWVEPVPSFADMYQVRSSIRFGKMEDDYEGS